MVDEWMGGCIVKYTRKWAMDAKIDIERLISRWTNIYN
jgi:hypothetical protein